MAKLFSQLFATKRPEIHVGEEIGEISIYIPSITDRLNPLYYEFAKKKKLYFTCPLGLTCLELKLRIKGVIKISIERIVLFFLGAILEDQQVIPFEVYEQEPTENSDEDIFRPRIYLHIEDEEVVQNDNQSSHSQKSEDNIQETFMNDQVVPPLVEENNEIDPHSFTRKDHQHIERHFNFIKNLERIHCERYAASLIQEGYDDEGSFSFLTEEVLKGSPLFIPLVPRKRILALADATKRRLFQDNQLEKENVTTMIESQLLQSQQIKTKKVDGMDEEFLTKAEINRAWNRKKKTLNDGEETSLGSQDEYLKPLPDSVRTLIKQIQINSQRDEFNLLINPSLSIHNPPPHDMDHNLSYWCCSKHHNECLHKRQADLTMRRLMIQAMLQEECHQLEDYHTSIGYVAKYQLQFILQQIFQRCKLTHLKDNKYLINQLINNCVMTKEEQQSHHDHSSQISRENLCCDLPLRAYSIQTFINVITEFILNYEMNILLNQRKT